MCSNKPNPKLLVCQASVLSLHFNFHGWLHRLPKARPCEISWSIGFMCSGSATRECPGLFPESEIKSNFYTVSAKWKKTRNLLYYVMVISPWWRQWIHFFWSFWNSQQSMAQVREGKHLHSFLELASLPSQDYEHRAADSWDMPAFLVLLGLKCEGQTPLFLLTLAFSVHP